MPTQRVLDLQDWDDGGWTWQVHDPDEKTTTRYRTNRERRGVYVWVPGKARWRQVLSDLQAAFPEDRDEMITRLSRSFRGRPGHDVSALRPPPPPPRRRRGATED